MDTGLSQLVVIISLLLLPTPASSQQFPSLPRLRIRHCSPTGYRPSRL